MLLEKYLLFSLCLFYSISVDDSLLHDDSFDGPEKKTIGRKYDKTRFGLKLA